MRHPDASIQAEIGAFVNGESTVHKAQDNLDQPVLCALCAVLSYIDIFAHFH